MHRILVIAARTVAILGIGFISLFALDVFEPGRPPLDIAIALVMHLIPSFVLVFMLLVAWRWPLAGGVLYLAIAAVPFFIGSAQPLATNAILAGPFALAGALFLAAALTRDRTA